MGPSVVGEDRSTDHSKVVTSKRLHELTGEYRFQVDEVNRCALVGFEVFTAVTSGMWRRVGLL
jgi:hypothetical protein